jgi:hypothetical protein
MDVPPPKLSRLRKKLVSREILAVCVGVLCRPFGTRLPGTAVPGYRLFRPYGTGFVAVSKSLRTSQEMTLLDSSLKALRVCVRALFYQGSTLVGP